MKCRDCVWYFEKEDDLIPYCQYDGAVAPCEEEEEEEIEDRYTVEDLGWNWY